MFLFGLELDLVLLDLVQVLEQHRLIDPLFCLINKRNIFQDEPFARITESTNSIESLNCLALMFKGSSNN
jgi:hypothetical protein